MAKDKLNEKQEKFCHEYVVDNNGAQAAIRAGYSFHTAKEQASKLLTIVNVEERITYLKSLLTKKANLDATTLIEEFKSIGFSNITDYLKEDMSLTELHKLPRHISAAIQSIDINEIKNPDGEGSQTIIKFKLHDKVRAMDALGKNFGIYEEHNKQKKGTLDLSKLSDSELIDLIQLQAKAKRPD